MRPSDRKALDVAANVIKQELLEHGEVVIPGLGKFYTSNILVYEGVHPMADADEFDQSKIKPRKSVRFRTYRSFFKQMNPGVRW